ncbi:MAG: peptidylprolyl isomerase [Myxococcota bacterium]
MEIAKDKVVTIAYVLRDASGKELDKSDPESPMRYLHGHRNIVPGLERQLEGKTQGDEIDAVVPPGEGYGEKQKVKSLRVPRSQLPADAPVHKGAQLVMQSKGQHFPVWVEKVQGPTVVLTPQHPLAGVELHFHVEVLDIRDASEEEITHGHVHGPGGHEEE